MSERFEIFAGRPKMVRVHLGASALVLLGFAGTPARADLKLCNNTASAWGVAIATKDREAGPAKAGGPPSPRKPDLAEGYLIARYTMFTRGLRQGGSGAARR